MESLIKYNSFRNLLIYHKSPGCFWFRVCGYGLDFVTYKLHPTLFSERNGYRKPIFKTRSFRVFVLVP